MSAVSRASSPISTYRIDNCPLPPDVTERTVIDVVRHHAANAPNRLALVANSPTDGEVRLTYAQLLRQSETVAKNLSVLGLRRGDHIGLMLGNTAARELVLTMLGAMRLGAVGVLLNPRSAAEELLHAVDLTDCRMLVYAAAASFAAPAAAGTTADPPAMAALRSIGGSRLLHPGIVIEVGDGTNPHALEWRTLLTDVPALALEALPECPREDDVADIILTSGTTGRSKAVMLTHANTVTAGVATARGLGLRPSDIVQTAVPMTSSGGHHVCLMGALCAGATMVIEPVFDALSTFARWSAERTSVYITVPSVYAFLLDRYDAAQHDASSLRLFDFGAAPMAAEMIRRLRRSFPHVELRQNYGLTESGPVGTYLAGDFMEAKIGSIGRPQLCQIRVVGEDGRDVPIGEAGEFWIRGPGVMKGYYKDAAATEAAIAEGGWLKTGDIGRVDGDGFYWHLDRKKDIIKRGGMTISSMEVEDALLRHPAVQEVAVVGVPHEKLGEDVFAFVVPRPGSEVDAAELGAFCADKIATNKIPRRIALTNVLPKNTMGKILKTALRARAAELLKK